MTDHRDKQPPTGGAAAPPDMAWLFFRFDGRIGREAYWLGLGFIWVLFLGLVMALGEDLEEAAEGGLFWVAFIISQWAELALLVKRLHDRALPGLWALVKFIPFAGILWMILAGLMSGDDGANGYGEGPEQRGAGPLSPGPPRGGGD